MITIFTISYNESVMIKFMIDHYRSRFPGCKIVVNDNCSDDDTVDIAKANGCEVITYNTNNQISDSKYLEIKNNCWKTAKTDWVLVCDMDELLDITESQLREESQAGATVIKSEGYNMISMTDDLNLNSITYGTRTELHDKTYLFNKSKISHINYQPGCHICNPVGSIVPSQKSYKAFHYKFINKQFVKDRYKLFASRLSEENKKNKWGWHYMQTDEQMTLEWNSWASRAIKIK